MSGSAKRKRNRSGFLFNNDVQLMQSGSEFFSTLEKLIDKAEYEIHFQTYIFSEDETGSRISNALINAARRGVKIFVLLDGYGSNDLSPAFINQWKSEKIELRFFGRVFKNGRLHIGRRLHRKIIVIDGFTSIVSGNNISNNYNSVQGSVAWLDFSVVVKGEASGILQRICEQSWYKVRFRRLTKKLPQHPKQKIDRPQHPRKIRIRQNDWKFRKNQAAQSYYQLMTMATESLLIVGGYFLPGRKGRRLLKKAANRGVVVKLVVAERSDVGVMRNATLYLYDWLLRNQIRIFEYTPSNVHGKGIVADEKTLSIGSYDLNALSTYSNIELNLDVDDAEIASQFHQQMTGIIEKDCREITEENFKTRKGVFKKLLRWSAYRIVKSLFVFSIWLSRKDNEDIYQ